MGKELIELDELFVELADTSEEEHEPQQVLPMTMPSGLSPSGFAPPYNVKEALSLVEGADKLFNFDSSSLNPVQQLYIVSYAVRGTHARACQQVGVSYNAVKKWMENNEEFFEALRAASELVTDALEEELIRRALNGSDKLLLEAVKARNKRYQPKSHLNVEGEVAHVHTWADLAKQASEVITIQAEEVSESDTTAN